MENLVATKNLLRNTETLAEVYFIIINQCIEDEENNIALCIRVVKIKDDIWYLWNKLSSLLSFSS